MFSSISEFYKFVDSLIDRLHEAGEVSWEADLKDALASGFTSGEILGDLRIKFRQLQKTDTAKSLHLDAEVELALDYLNEALGRR